MTWIYLGYSAEIKPKYTPYLSEHISTNYYLAL
nr:MAG TPA: hypothetical protein [Caudoviricetes sp.]